VSHVHPSGDFTEGMPSETRIMRTIKLGDTTYELFVGPCAECGRHPVFRLMRTCEASLSVYEISPDDAQNLDEYVAKLNTSFSVDVATKLVMLRKTISEFNSKGLFEAAGMHPFRVRLIDKARLIHKRFSQNGLLEQLLHHSDDAENDIALAFILGCIATENHWLEFHQEAVFEGYAHIEGRENGRPLALEARIRQGKRTRKAVIAAASKLYDQDPSLRRNDSRTANRIMSMKLESLRKRDGTFLGSDAIVKHLRAVRLKSSQVGKSQ
jgi:hypothetical protein